MLGFKLNDVSKRGHRAFQCHLFLWMLVPTCISLYISPRYAQANTAIHTMYSCTHNTSVTPLMQNTSCCGNIHTAYPINVYMVLLCFVLLWLYFFVFSELLLFNYPHLSSSVALWLLPQFIPVNSSLPEQNGCEMAAILQTIILDAFSCTANDNKIVTMTTIAFQWWGTEVNRWGWEKMATILLMTF